MAEAIKLMRSSINGFLQSYHSFASIAAMFVFPLSASVLLSQAFAPSSHIVGAISSRLGPLFEAACFPTSRFLALLDLKIPQTIFSFVVALPFTLTVLILAKVLVVQTLCGYPRPPSSFLHLYYSVFKTHIVSYFIVLSANSSIFAVLFIAFNAADIFGLSDSSILTLFIGSGVLYSMILASVTVTCNLATMVSVMDNMGGYLPFVKACFLIRGRLSTVLTLALPANAGMAAMEVLFQYRVMKPYVTSSGLNPSIVSEAFTIAYVHSLLMVLDIVMSCMFFKSCKWGYRSNWEFGYYCLVELELEEKGALQA